MDKNTITGLIIIFLILIGFSYFNRPSEEEIQARQRKQDSLALVEKSRLERAEQQQKKFQQIAEAQNETIFLQDSVTPQTIVLENDKIKLHITL